MSVTIVSYRVDPGLSRFTVQAFATGLLSVFGHSPTFVVRDYRGLARLVPGTFEDAWFEMTVRADSLEVTGDVTSRDRGEIEERMRQEVLQTAAYPEIRYQAGDASAERVSVGRHRLRLAGELTLRGVTRPQVVEGTLLVFEDGVRVAGEFELRQSDYGIRPVSALGGAITLKDRLKVSFDIGALKEGEG
jgi:polyisoprenoid-binding protein YceI